MLVGSRNSPSADSFDPDLDVDNLDDEFLLGDQLDELPAPEPLIEGVLSRHAYGITVALVSARLCPA
jgi:hypothetical protein